MGATQAAKAEGAAAAAAVAAAPPSVPAATQLQQQATEQQQQQQQQRALPPAMSQPSTVPMEEPQQATEEQSQTSTQDEQQQQAGQPGQRRLASQCPQCSAPASLRPTPGSKAWTQCQTQECSTWVKHGRQLYTCNLCKAELCPVCAGRSSRKRAPQHPIEPVLEQRQQDMQPTPPPPPPLTDLPEETAQESTWLAILRSFPTVRRCQLVQWIPDRVAQRYADLRIAALEQLVDATDRRAHPDTLELYSRLALAMPHLLLRYSEAPSRTSAADTADPAMTQLAAIRGRLLLAEQNQWTRLLTEALRDEEARMTALATMRTGPQRDAHLDRLQPETYSQAARAADEGDVRKAKRLLMGMRLLPATEATCEKIMALFPPAAQCEEDFAPAAPVSTVRHPRAPVHSKHVLDFVRSCRRQAHPGPAGERNAHIAAAMRCPRAAGVLARWANLWATAAIPLQARIPWLQMTGIGGDKGKGKARPIVFQEVLFKLAAGCIAQAEDGRISAQVGPLQYAAGVRPGTAQMIWETEAEMAACAQDIFFGLDIENAFGTTRRSDAHLEALECSTATAQLQWNMWYGGAQQQVWLQVGNSWRQVTMATGVCQGGCSAKQDFTLAFARAQRTADAKVQVELGDDLPARPSKRLYMDDECVRAPRRVWRRVLEAIRTGLAAHGYRLRTDKTKAHCPAAQGDAALATELAAELHGHAEFMLDGLPLLGKVADGEHLTVVTAHGPLTGPTAARMESARTLAQGIHAMLDAGIEGKAAGPAWKLTSLVLNKALSYDVCVSPPDRLRPHTDELDDLVAMLARRLVDPALTDRHDAWPACLAQLREPRQHGGLDLTSATSIAPYAFLSTALAILPAATHGLAHLRMLYTPGDVTLPQAIEDAMHDLDRAGLVDEAISAQTTLATEGVLLDDWGMPNATTSPLCIRNAAKAGIDLRHRRRAWLRERADSRLAGLASEARAHRWTHGGEEGGLGFLANACSDLATWDDAEFTINLRRRLRLHLATPGATCTHMRRSARQQGHSASDAPDAACSAPLDVHADHAIQCMIGGDHNAIHDAGADEIARMQQQAGLRSRREVYLPQLATRKKTEPRADIVCWGTPALPVTRLDFTVVSPWASRNAKTMLERPAATAKRAEDAKADEYGSKGGISVQGIALEAGGRFGPQLDAHLRLLASLARARDGLAGREPRHHLRTWRTRLAVLLGRFTAHTVTTALGGHTCLQGSSPSDVQLCVGPPRWQQQQPFRALPLHATTTTTRSATDRLCC